MLPGLEISVIGCGYPGAVHAACMADLGHDVVVDPEKVDKFAAGVPPFHQPGLARRVVAAHRLRATGGAGRSVFCLEDDPTLISL